MKIKLPFKLLVGLLFISFIGFSQVCGEQFTDSGGINGNYSNGESITTTICPDVAGEVVTVQFSSFDTEACCDSLTVYDGSDTTSLLAELVGTNLPPTFTSTSTDGCLTFVWHSDGSVTRPGWVANILC